MADPVYTLGVEYTSGSFTNISSLVERASWDSSLVDMFNSPKPGRAMFELSNDGGSLTPKNNTNLKPGKAIKLDATYSGSTFPLFFGRIVEVSARSALGRRKTLVEAVDEWERLSRVNYNTGLLWAYPVTSLFTVLMSLSGVRSFSVDAIPDVVDFAWYKDRDPLNALHQLAISGDYNMLADGAGTFALRGRYWSFFNTTVATYTEVADEARYFLHQDSVVNRMKMLSQTRRQISTTTTLAFLPSSPSLTIPASSSIAFWLAYQDPEEPGAVTPVGSIVSPVQSTDYYATTDVGGGGTDQTSAVSLNLTNFAASAVASLFNGTGSAVYLHRFQIRGYPIRRDPEIAVQYDIASSQTEFGVKAFVVENPLVQNRSFMDSLCQVIATNRKDGLDRADYSLINEFPDVIRNSIGDSISVVNSFSGYVNQWRIREARHEIEMTAGLKHKTQYLLETTGSAPFLVLDHATFGQLDNGRVLGV